MINAEILLQVLPGDHTRPLLQTVGDVPPELRQAASSFQSQGEDFFNRLSSAATQAGFGQVLAIRCRWPALHEQLHIRQPFALSCCQAQQAQQLTSGAGHNAMFQPAVQASQSLNDFAKGITNLGTALNGSLASTNDAVTAEMQCLADEIADWMAESVVLRPLPELPAAGEKTT